MIAYVLRGIIVVLLTLIIVLMVCGVLYIKEHLAPAPDSEPPVESRLIDDPVFSEPPIVPAAPSVPGEVVIHPRDDNGTE